MQYQTTSKTKDKTQKQNKNTQNTPINQLVNQKKLANMNTNRRKEIAKAIALIEETMHIIDCAAEEEREAYDNLPEGIQYSERGERMEEAAEALESASCELSDIDNLNEVIEN